METEGVKERLIKFLDWVNISQSKFEKMCGMSNGYVNNIRQSIQPDKLKKIAQIFPGLNITWLLIGDATGEQMLRDNLKPEENEEDYDAPCVDQKFTLPLLPVDAVAGYGSPSFDIDRIEDYYNVRDFNGSDFLLRVKGDSMLPRYTTGDIVACKIVREALFFQWGHVYAISTKSQGVMIKRLQPSENEDCIRCVSDNEKYAPFDVPKSDIVALALVNGSISLE